MIQSLEWTASGVRFIDQTKLPNEEVYVTCTTHQQVAEVIRNMVVRGAPAIGVAAAMGIALGVKNSKAENIDKLRQDIVHGELLGSEIADIDDKLSCLRNAGFYFFKMMHNTFGLRIDTTVFTSQPKPNT